MACGPTAGRPVGALVLPLPADIHPLIPHLPTPISQPDGEIQTTEDENTGRTYYVPELNDEKKPFRCILDVGIATTSTGNRLFGVLKVRCWGCWVCWISTALESNRWALLLFQVQESHPLPHATPLAPPTPHQGASDGGLDIPQSEKRFPGYDREGKKYDADMHKERILGTHVADYMNYLNEVRPQAVKGAGGGWGGCVERGLAADASGRVARTSPRSLID